MNPFYKAWESNFYEWENEHDFEEEDAEEAIARREYDDCYPNPPREI